MYTLYWESLSGAMAPQAMFEELGIAYEKHAVDMAAGEHHEADYLAVNPTGQVPALKLPDGAIMTESAAMVLVIGERHPEGGLVPQPGESDRAQFLRWLLFMASSLYMTFLRLNHAERYTSDEKGASAVREVAMEHAERFFAIIEEAIAGQPFFLARGYSALDIYLAMLASWYPDRDGLFQRNPKIAALCRAVEARPAFARVLDDGREAES